MQTVTLKPAQNSLITLEKRLTSSYFTGFGFEVIS